MSDLDKQLMNADSFDELYLAYYPAMLSYARMFLRDQWAEDVVQDVFFNIWKNRHRISTDDPLYKYLLKAVYNRAINYIWKHKRDTEYRSWYGSQIDRMVFDYYDPDKNPILAKIYDNDMRQQLRQAVDELELLSLDSRAALLPLGEVLGRYEADSQRQALEHARQALEREEQRAQEERRRLGRVYQALGLSGGAFLVILLL